MTTHKQFHRVPKLRFPEFREAPAWSIEALGRLFQERKEAGFSELPLLSVTDRDGVVPQEETNRKNTANSNKAKYLRVAPGDIVYNTMRMWEGRSARVSMEGVVSPAYTVCRPDVETNSYFFTYYFKTRSLINQFKKYSQGLVKDTLNLKYETFSLIQVGFPAFNEQKKIADCLGSLDDLVTAKDRKLKALRQYKQGLMQQLFPQPGETVPRLRFPEFAQDPGWDHAQVVDLVETVSPPKKLNTSTYLADGRFPIIDQSQSDICGWTNDDEAVITSPLPVIVFGDHTCVLKFVDQPFAQGADGVKILKARRPVSTLYLYHQLTYRPVVTEEYKRHFSALKDKVVCFPDPKSGEQQKIANCLGTLDDLIAVEGHKIESLRQHKRGLMQQVFPSLEGH